MVNEQNLEKHMEKQMGCMAGFLQLFDRHQILSGKRHYSAKRLPSFPVVDSASESEKSAPQSPAVSRELIKPKQPCSVATSSPERPKPSPVSELRSPLAAAAGELQPKSPLPLPIFELKEGAKSSWRFCKEAPRLSLDSRATTDAKGGLHPKEIRTGASILSTASRSESIASDATDESQQHRSPSVIARLMGLEPVPDSSTSEPEKKPELRRSASESRVSRDLFNSRLMADGSNLCSKQQTRLQSELFDNVVKDYPAFDAHYADPRKAEQPKGLNRGSIYSSSPWKAPQHRKSFFDSGDFFPEPKQTVSVHGEIENRLRMRGIDEPSKDLETWKQILEALQLKGLLHRKPSEQNQVGHRNFIYDESPIVVMRPSNLSTSTPINRRMGNDYSPSSGRNQNRGVRRNLTLAGESSPSVSPRRERNGRSSNQTGRSPSPTSRSEGNVVRTRSNSLVKPKPLSVETQRRTKESTENRRVSPVHSPKLNPRRTVSDPTVNNRSPRSRRATAGIHQKEKTTAVVAAEDESSSISGSSITTSTDTTERSKTEEYKEGRSLLERCDKLLHSIAEMNAADMQPSPVSVLDSSLYKDESSTPSPVTIRRNLDFKDHSGELEDELWSPLISPVRLKCQETSEDCDFVYISEILRASHYLPEDSDVFLLLEKQQYLKGKDASKVSRLQRKLIFDTINEILNRNRRLPPWKVVTWTNYHTTKPSLDMIWIEFQRIRERDTDEQDLSETICGVLKKDLARDAITGWEDCPVEMSEAILDIERLIFKDLISETIRDLAALASRNTITLPRRKLVF
ncbi:hypothetical protein CDL12_14546 [Handroanthus impetiginosus]|uniref:DUF4378 domain-containing protein n=1 Tax=Handroanthus impetiginosus TaxID=429701 RepID=A0A2G9H5Q4_9LAMI|nr:hypothetical protein CDL12_14546 [Handroanthus impetiginosus]